MAGPQAALLLTLVVHVIGAVVLLWTLFAGQDEKPDWRGWWRGDDGDDPKPPTDKPSPRGGVTPLPGAEQSPFRLREPGRIASRYERPRREPQHEPQREPVPRN